MAAVSAILKKKVKSLYYSDKKSAREISEILHVPIGAVYYCMRHEHLPRRTVSENNAIRFSRKVLSFAIPPKLSKEQNMLKIMGTMLYWAEGHKTDKAPGVDFANSVPYMVVIFIRFLREVCCVTEKRIKISLYCYSDQNIPK